jgi:hypothetical protein
MDIALTFALYTGRDVHQPAAQIRTGLAPDGITGANSLRGFRR